MEEKRISSRKTRVGKVVSDKMDKTVVVAIEDRVAHPLYKKIVGRTYKLKAHDEQNACGVGDVVKVMETRPLSKDKRWRVVEIVEKANPQCRFSGQNCPPRAAPPSFVLMDFISLVFV